MSATGILRDKIAVVFGASGSIGSAVAKKFAGQGAEVFLAGRNKSAVAEVAAGISAAGGGAHAATVDALDESAVQSYLRDVIGEAGRVDVLLNAVGPRVTDYRNGTLAVDLPVDAFMVPLMTVVKSQFITARAAAQQMVKQHSGVIIFLTGSPARGHVEGGTAIGAAFGAVETLMENLAFEIGPHGVRTVCLRTTANVDSRAIQDTAKILSDRMNVSGDQFVVRLAGFNFLKSPATVNDTANAAVLIAGDAARMMTGTVLNVTAGAALD